MAQELTYYVCSDGLAPAITGRHPSGNRPILAGSSASVSWQAMNGDIAEGYKLRLTAGSVNFGTKPQAVPTLIDDGKTQLFNGVQDTYYNDKADGFSLVTKAVDPNVPWQKPSTGSTTVIDRQTERYLGQGFTYAMGKNGQGVCFIGWHKTLPDNHTVESDEFHISFYLKTSSPFLAWRKYLVGSVTGTFQFAPDAFSVGEQVTGVNGTTTRQGYVIAQRSDGSFEFAFDGSIPSSGMVVTGQTSGAVLTATGDSTTFTAASSNKILRVWSGDENLVGRYRYSSWSHDLADPPYGVSGTNNFADTIFMDSDKWFFCEFTSKCLDRPQKLFRTVMKIDGQVKHDMTGIEADDGALQPYALACALIGKDPNQDVNVQMWVSTVYMDVSTKRVTLTDSEDYSASTIFEPQDFFSYSPTLIDSRLRLGALKNSGEIYAHIFDGFDLIASARIK